MGADAASLILPADARLRLLAAFLVVAAVSQIDHLAPALAVAAALALAALAERPQALTLRRLLHLEGFAILLVATLPFVVPGRPLAEIGPLTATFEGTLRALLLVVKVTASALAILLFLSALEPARLGAALRAMHVPEALVGIFLLTTRYLTLLRGEAVRLDEAMRARAFRPGSNRHTWKSYGNLVGMLLVRALDRAERVEEAMRCRGYQGRFPRPTPPPPAGRDWIGFSAAAVLALLAVVADR